MRDRVSVMKGEEGQEGYQGVTLGCHPHRAEQLGRGCEMVGMLRRALRSQLGEGKEEQNTHLIPK